MAAEGGSGGSRSQNHQLRSVSSRSPTLGSHILSCYSRGLHPGSHTLSCLLHPGLAPRRKGWALSCPFPRSCYFLLTVLLKGSQRRFMDQDSWLRWPGSGWCTKQVTGNICTPEQWAVCGSRQLSLFLAGERIRGGDKIFPTEVQQTERGVGGEGGKSGVLAGLCRTHGPSF